MDTQPNTTTPPRPSLSKRLFARMMANRSGQNDELLGERKRSLLGGLHGSILEIGPGTGPNLAYYPADVTWVGVEPNPAMHPYLYKEAQRLGMQVVLHGVGAEHLPAADASLDAVVATHVLCSVGDQSRALQEVLRVLKPGGRFVFIEHVAAQPHTSTRRIQGWIRPVWQVFGDGCHLDRETWVAIQTAGFSAVELEHFNIGTPFVGPHIAGTAVK
jgi:ubiquinone/menaquinone biosynthesis C-methylase UbiE